MMSRNEIEINITRSLLLKITIGLLMFLSLVLFLNRQSQQRMSEKFAKNYTYYNEHPSLDSIKLFLDTMTIIDFDNYRKLSEWIPSFQKRHSSGAALWIKREGKYCQIPHRLTLQKYKFEDRYNTLSKNMEEAVTSSDVYQAKLDYFLTNGHGHLIIMLDSTEERKAFLQSDWISGE